MTIGMAVTIPATREEWNTLRRIVLLLDEAAFHATGAGLTIEGHEGAEFLSSLSSQLTRTLAANRR